MTKYIVVAMAVAGLSTAVYAADSIGVGQPITVASYYFGNYHPGDPRNEKLKGKGWSEWELVKAAKPRFPGHRQPKVPLWGYQDESDPKVMARKIDAAADHGIDVFIFDWYYYSDGPFLEGAVDRGFLKAANNKRLKFALMWANHDWLDIQPVHETSPKLIFPGRVTPETFDVICDRVIRDYFLHPSYWRLEGKPYFSFYDLNNLLAGFGGNVAATRAALDHFRAKAVKAGLPGLHLNLVAWGAGVLPFEKKLPDVAEMVRELGFDSVTSYVWVHHAELPQLKTDYNRVRDQYFRYWDLAKRTYPVPYIPNVTVGWDGTPRNYQMLHFGNTMSGNSPERFREALKLTKERLLADPKGPRILNINCWNEWTEGSYLEPDTVHGMQYLEAVRAVFRKEVSKSAAPKGQFSGNQP